MSFERSPILVFWETTRACLLSCRHCRASAIPEPLPGELTTEEGMRLVEEVRAFGPRSPVLIFTGGDPFMRRDVFALAGLARSLGVPVGFAPSVTPLLTEDAMDRMGELGVKTVSISLDGAGPASHEGVRGVAGHFAKTTETIGRLVERGFTVQVNTTVMRSNVEELADVAALVASLGAHIWEVFFLIRVGRGAELGELAPRQNEDVAHFLFDASRYGFIVRTVEGPFFRRVVAWRRALSPEADPADRLGLGPLYRRLRSRLREKLGEPGAAPRAQSAGTRDGKGILFVAHNGDVYPAGFLPLALGNVRHRSLVDIYRLHPLLQAIRRADFGGRCGVCEFRDACGGSRARATAVLGDPLGEDPACAYLPLSSPGTGAGEVQARGEADPWNQSSRRRPPSSAR